MHSAVQINVSSKEPVHKDLGWCVLLLWLYHRARVLLHLGPKKTILVLFLFPLMLEFSAFTPQNTAEKSKNIKFKVKSVRGDAWRAETMSFNDV